MLCIHIQYFLIVYNIAKALIIFCYIPKVYDYLAESNVSTLESIFFIKYIIKIFL